MASLNPLDSRFRGNDGQKIGGNGAIIVRFSLMSTRPRARTAIPRNRFMNLMSDRLSTKRHAS